MWSWACYPYRLWSPVTILPSTKISTIWTINHVLHILHNSGLYLEYVVSLTQSLIWKISWGVERFTFSCNCPIVHNCPDSQSHLVAAKTHIIHVLFLKYVHQVDYCSQGIKEMNNLVLISLSQLMIVLGHMTALTFVTHLYKSLLAPLWLSFGLSPYQTNFQGKKPRDFLIRFD